MLIAYCELWCGAGVVSSSDGEGVGRGDHFNEQNADYSLKDMLVLI